MRAITYARVSTDAQERDGTSLDTQERACLEFARDQGWVVVESVRDAASGFSLDRAGIERVRQILRAGLADVVIAYAVDRLSRNQNQIGVMFDEIQQAGAKLEFVTERFEDTAVGRFILAARAFVGEVEREKMSERTSRGKLERARSGRIPQAFGRGCYGYTYNPSIGQRQIEPFQAEVVRRIFARYAETRSFDRVSYELNQDGITAFDGGRWYPITIRRLLTNESYAGRLIYRRSRWVKTRGTDGKMHRRQVERPIEDRVEIVGASPQIVDEALWRRVQAIIEDPERTKRAPTPARTYELRGRMKCGLCGASMVGQTLKIKDKPYPYYRCRHAYDRRNGKHCETRYIRALDLEGSVWREVTAVLSRPSVVLDELEQARAGDQQPDHAEETTRLEREISSLKDREKRLVRLYTFGEIDDETVRTEGAEVRRRRQFLEERLTQLAPSAVSSAAPVDRSMLDRACAVVVDWLSQAGPEQRMMALEALQVAITTTRESATIAGVLPVESPSFITDEQSCRCTLQDKKLGQVEREDPAHRRLLAGRGD